MIYIFIAKVKSKGTRLFSNATSNKTFDRSTLIGITVIHCLALLAFFTFSWVGFFSFLIMVVITGGWGIAIGYHRLLTHRSFETPKFIRYFLTLCGCLALQGGPVRWVATHRLHHKHADTPRDPHSSKEGFLWSHLCWNFYKQPELVSQQSLKRYAPDIDNDGLLHVMDKYVIPINLMFAALLFAIGYLIGGWTIGLSVLVWGGFFRIVYVWHSTWLVNSATHYWGYQSAQTVDESRNNWFVGWLAFGEGWHHNHHAYPRSARCGRQWFEFDSAYLMIRLLRRLGLASNVITLPI